MLRVTRQSYPSNNAMFFFTENSQNRYDEVTGGPGASKDKWPWKNLSPYFAQFCKLKKAYYTIPKWLEEKKGYECKNPYEVTRIVGLHLH